MQTGVIDIIRGDDEAIEITIKDENAVSLLENGNIFFITVKNKISDTDTNAKFKKEYTLTADTELYNIDLSNTETELPLGVYHMDIQWKDNQAKIKTIFRGKLNVTYDVTRRKTV